MGGVFVLDRSGILNYKLRAGDCTSEVARYAAARDAILNRPPGPALFWWEGISVPILPVDDELSLLTRWVREQGFPD